MADIVRILGLDDDNHAPMFVFETGEVFDTPRELIEFLSHSHDVEYQVKVFALVDEWSGGLADYNEDEVAWMFAFMEGLTSSLPADIHPDMVFELFWNSANRGYW